MTFYHPTRLLKARTIATGLAAFLVAVSLAAAPAFGQPSNGEEKPRVAILDFSGTDTSQAEKEAVTDQLRNELVNIGIYVVLERSQIEAVLKEQAFQQAGLTDQNQAVQLGKLLNVNYVVMGRVTKLGNAYQVNVQMIDVKTAEIVRSEAVLYRGDIVGLIGDNISTIANRLASKHMKEARQAGRAQQKVAQGSSEPPRPREEVREEPEPEGPPSGKPGWALWTGAGLTVAAVAIFGNALSANSEAETMISNGNTAGATDLRTQAESDASTALGLGLGGLGLMTYYLMAKGNPAVVHATAPDAPLAVLPLLAWNGRGDFKAGVHFRW